MDVSLVDFAFCLALHGPDTQQDWVKQRAVLGAALVGGHFQRSYTVAEFIDALKTGEAITLHDIASFVESQLGGSHSPEYFHDNLKATIKLLAPTGAADTTHVSADSAPGKVVSAIAIAVDAAPFDVIWSLATQFKQLMAGERSQGMRPLISHFSCTPHSDCSRRMVVDYSKTDNQGLKRVIQDVSVLTVHAAISYPDLGGAAGYRGSLRSSARSFRRPSSSERNLSGTLSHANGGSVVSVDI